MNDQSLTPKPFVNYIETPRRTSAPEKIDHLLEKRMREFLLSRRQRRWLEKGE